MTPERWRQVKEILATSLELEPQTRNNSLDTVCGADPGMRAEVESLIAAYEEAGDLMESPAGGKKFSLSSSSIETEPLRRIGPYFIVERIAQGGMGAVYRCYREDDPDRKPVAVKVLKPGADSSFVLRRFSHEREIVANLHHPNIARFLDGGSTGDGLPYFVMEFIEGRPIDEYCDARGLSTEDRLRLFVTLCSVIEFAHQKGIVHRDIKPNNVLVDAGGVLKLLDFGIAKILDPDFSSQPISVTGSMMRLMTPDYASPEQIKGEPVTVATDVYALGVVLYELLTGRRPYHLKRGTPLELMQAICEKDPEKPSTAVAGGGGTTSTAAADTLAGQPPPPPVEAHKLEGDLDAIILKAIRKHPGERYPSVKALQEDIERHLNGATVLARLERPRSSPAPEAGNRRTLWVAVAIAAVLLVFALAPLVRSYLASSRKVELPFVTPVTTFPGVETQPYFSPDGEKIVYVWRREESRNSDIYVRTLATGEQMRLTTDPAEDLSPVWSPDGKQIAFLRTSPKETAVFVSPADGGVHRKIAEVYPMRFEAVGRHLDWSPDGKWLAVADKSVPEEPFSIFSLSVVDGGKKRLTHPPEKVLGDSNPAFSPDGKWVSFLRAPSRGVADVYLASLRNGETRRITFDNRSIQSQTWDAHAQSILFSSDRTGALNLWRISVQGGAVLSRLPGMGENATEPVYSKDGKMLAYSQISVDANIWRAPLAGGPAQSYIVSTYYDSSPSFSPDGQRIAFRSNRSGSNEIWVSDADGRDPLQLTRFGGPLTGTPRWSPDGSWIAFDSRPQGQSDIFLIRPEGGNTHHLTREPSEDVVASWSRDGKWVYFASNRSGQWQVWRTSIDGVQKQQVTQDGGFCAMESADGRHIYFAKGPGEPGLVRRALASGQERVVLPSLKAGYWGYWALTRDRIFFVDQDANDPQAAIYSVNLDGGDKRLVFTMEKAPSIADSAFAISPDQQWILYTQIDRSGGDIMLADYSR